MHLRVDDLHAPSPSLIMLDAAGRTRAQPRQGRGRHHGVGEVPARAEGETQWSVIGEGVREGERVIVTNLDELTAGVRVEVVGRGE